MEPAPTAEAAVMHVVRILPLLLLAFGPAAAAERGPLPAGLEPGRRPGPYSALVAVGPERGQLHCYICETAERPAVIVFARGLSEPLGKLVEGLDRAVLEHRAAGLR